MSGLGLMIGVRLEERMDAKLVASRCAENGLMILTAKTKLRIMPPLNITMDEIDRGLNVLRGCLSGLGDRDETKKINYDLYFIGKTDEEYSVVCITEDVPACRLYD